MKASEYKTYIPKKFVTASSRNYNLSKYDLNLISKEPIFKNWIPAEKINNVRNYLIESGFKKPDLAFDEGEILGLTKSLSYPWEFHIRIFENGDLISHVEINRKYFQHLGNIRVFTAYEAYNYYKPVVKDFYLKYVKNDEDIIKVNENKNITLPVPTGLTPWKPVIAAGIIAAFGGTLYYLLGKNKK